MLGRGAEEGDPLARVLPGHPDAPHDGVVVGVARQLGDPHQLATRQDVVALGEPIPFRQPDVSPGRGMVAEGHVRDLDRPEHGPGDGLSAFVEDDDGRVDRRTEPPAERLQDEATALLRLEL